MKNTRIAEPTLTNERARREWAWLCKAVGEHTARVAIAMIPGNRRPYPVNIAKALGLSIPKPESLPALVEMATGDDLEMGIALARDALRKRTEHVE